MQAIEAERLAGADNQPIVGHPGEQFGGQQVAAACIVAGLLILVILGRRWAASARNDAAIITRLRYVFTPWVFGQADRKKMATRGLLVGTDNRVSTSKTTAALWTVVVAYFIATMALIIAGHISGYPKLFQSISPLYLVLLGGPFAAVVLAKATVSNMLSSKQAQKSTATKARVADVFSDDDGNTDLVDTQYILFNLLVAGTVIMLFARAPGNGAPTIPDFLAILTGSSAATYVANKALVSGNPPALDRIAPERPRAGAEVIAYGSNLIAQGDTDRPKVFIEGVSADTSGSAQQDSVAFRIPITAQPGPVTVTIRTPAGLEISKNTLLTITPDQVAITGVDSVYKKPGDSVTFIGSGFYNASDVTVIGKPIQNAPNPPPVRKLSFPAGILNFESSCGVCDG